MADVRSIGLVSRPSSAIACSIIPNHILALGAPKTGLLPLFTEAVKEGDKLWNVFVADVGISNSVWKKFGTRRRCGVEFGSEWVAELRFVAAT